MLLVALAAHCEERFDCILDLHEVSENQIRTIGAIADTVLCANRK